MPLQLEDSRDEKVINIARNYLINTEFLDRFKERFPFLPLTAAQREEWREIYRKDENRDRLIDVLYTPELQHFIAEIVEAAKSGVKRRSAHKSSALIIGSFFILKGYPSDVTNAPLGVIITAYRNGNERWPRSEELKASKTYHTMYQRQQDYDWCSICYDDFTFPTQHQSRQVRLPGCMHAYCNHCLLKWFKSDSGSDSFTCYLCMEKYTFNEIFLAVVRAHDISVKFICGMCAGMSALVVGGCAVLWQLYAAMS